MDFTPNLEEASGFFSCCMRFDSEQLYMTEDKIENAARDTLNDHTREHNLESTVETGLNKCIVNADIILENYADQIGYRVDHSGEEKPGHHGCTHFGEKKVVIYNNKNQQTNRFACAHELFHLRHHREYYEKYQSEEYFEAPDFFEKNANLYARTLLTPRTMFTAAADNFIDHYTAGKKLDCGTLHEVVRDLATVFGVAGKMAALRFKQLYPSYGQLVERTLLEYPNIFPRN